MVVPAALACSLLPRVARADGMGLAGMADVILAGASLVGCVLFLVPAAILGVVFLVLRGKPKHAARSVLGILALVLALPSELLLGIAIGQDIAEAAQRTDHALKLFWFLAPPFICAAVLAAAAVLLFRANRAAPPATAKS